jgi:septal ring factor EnvC (AmiA/AmiB activator)
MMTIPQHPSALADMMALLRVIEDPKATQAVLDAIAEAREKAMADLEHREAAFADACAAREKALEAREEALKRSEAELSRRRDKLTEALAGMPGGAR